MSNSNNKDSGKNPNKIEEQNSISQIEFNDNWDLSEIDNKQKLILLLQISKFTKTLEIILDQSECMALD